MWIVTELGLGNMVSARICMISSSISLLSLDGYLRLWPRMWHRADDLRLAASRKSGAKTDVAGYGVFVSFAPISKVIVQQDDQPRLLFSRQH
jgi:hypothetical protein